MSIARNEATFRSINEDIERGRDAEDDRTLVGFVCECGRLHCTRIIQLSREEYEGVRANPIPNRSGKLVVTCSFGLADVAKAHATGA